MDFDEGDEEMEMEISAGYDSGRVKTTGGVGAGGSEFGMGRKGIRYRECLKNHAVSIGAHAVDGCGEFMAAGDEGTLDALKCAACNCHRNFHRKEVNGDNGGGNYHNPPHISQFSPFYRAPQPSGYLHLTSPPPHRPLALPAAASGGGGGYSREEEDVSNPSSSGGGGSGSMKKRFRTKFTPEQKDKMLEFAERVGWRFQKHDEAAVEQFCEETGIKRQVLKVWMHNNKHTLGKKP